MADKICHILPTLKSLHEHKDTLRYFDWSLWVRKGDGTTIVDLICNNHFWILVKDCLKVLEPLLAVLHLVDGDTKLTLPSLASAYIAVKNVIKANFKEEKSKYEPIWKIMEKHWIKYFKSPLVYSPVKSVENNEAYLYEEAFEDCMEMMIEDAVVQTKLVMDANLYKNKADRFGSTVASLSVQTSKAGIWWQTFGTSTPELRIYAMRILSLYS